MNYTLHCGDCLDVLRTLPDCSVHCCVTSPPYWGLRDYGHEKQIGLEVTPDAYITRLVDVFRNVRRVIRDDGTLWLNLGDSYANKQLTGIPWRVAFALQDDGWYLRQDIIWHKPNPMPESVTDRCTKSHEYLFLLTKSDRYYYDHVAIKEPGTSRPPGNKGTSKYTAAYATIGDYHRTSAGLERPRSGYDVRNRRSVWTIAAKPYHGAHFAVMPEALVEPCVRAGCPESGTVLDPFVGSGTVGVVAVRQQKSFVGIELNADYLQMARSRIDAEQRPMLQCLQAGTIS